MLIDILLATYNGEKYLSEQLDSLFSQTNQDFRLIVRDDDSTDNTVSILEEYAKKYPNRIKIIHDDAICKSATKNFFELLKYAEADYVMFCDQDDVWLKYKVQITLDYMKETERKNPGKPVLIFTGLQVVDSELKSLDYLMGLNIPEKFYTFRELLACNCAAGCSQMLNRRAYEKLGEYQEGIRYHDWWTTLYASAFGVIERVPMALMLYRQHGGNAVSAYARGVSLPRRLLQYTVKAKEIAIETNKKMRSTIEIFHRRYADSLPLDKRTAIEWYLRLFSPKPAERYKAVKKYRDLSFYKRHPLVLLRYIFFGDK